MMSAQVLTGAHECSRILQVLTVFMSAHGTHAKSQEAYNDLNKKT